MGGDIRRDVQGTPIQCHKAEAYEKNEKHPKQYVDEKIKTHSQGDNILKAIIYQ